MRRHLRSFSTCSLEADGDEAGRGLAAVGVVAQELGVDVAPLLELEVVLLLDLGQVRLVKDEPHAAPLGALRHGFRRPPRPA